MKLLKKNARYILLGIILLASLWIRVNQLNAIPVGMTDDEVREVYSAYSLWHTGRDITQQIFLPFSFVMNGFSFTPVSIYITAPFVGLLELSPLSSRLPFALAGVGVIFLTYMLVKRLLGQPAVALLAASVLGINVWAIQLSRMAYEAQFALLFYLWGTVVFLDDWKKHQVRSVLWSMVLLFLGFNSYNAMKLVYIPLLLLLIWYKWNEIKAKKYLFSAIAGSVLVTLGIFAYFTLMQGASAHGGDFLIFQDIGSGREAVELARRASAAPHLLQVLFHNKLTYFVDQVARHYLYPFSPDFLFLSQEGSGIYSLWSRGNLYLIELPFLLIGLFYLWKKQKQVFTLAALMIIIAALPSAIGPKPFTYATRSSFMLPWLALFIAFGLYTAVKTKVLAVILFVLYAYYFFGYLNQYYFEWPRYSAASYAKDQKDLIAYISAYPDANAEFLISNVSDMFFLQYAFYTRMDPRELQLLYRKTPSLTRLGQMRIIPACLLPKDQDPRAHIPAGTVYMSKSCYAQNPDSVIEFPDGEPAWYIYKGNGPR